MPVEQVFYRAHSLAERHQMVDLANYTMPSEMSEVAQYWRAQRPFATSPELFKERLAQENMTESAFALLTSISKQGFPKQQNPSNWITFFSESMLSQDTDRSDKLPAVTDTKIRTSHFLKVVEPLLLKGVGKLKQQTAALVEQQAATDKVDVDRICDQLYQELAARCSMICSRAMVLELQIGKLENQLQGTTSEDRYQYFIETLSSDAQRAQILTDYPVMARLVTETILSWKRNSLNLISRLLQNWERLTDTFSDHELGSLQHIETSVGDTHKHGQTVSIIEFSSGKKLVYKPRSVAIETAFGSLLQWLNRKGFSPQLKSLKTIDCGDHGWVEFAEHRAVDSLADVQRFYQRQGGLLALLYALEANDFHYENIIANGEYPILVDLETLFHPWVNDLNNSAKEYSPASALKRTVLSVGLLPRRIWTQQGVTEGIDLSGLSEVQDQMTPTPVLDIDNIGTDNMCFVQKKVMFSGASNMPKIQGKSVRSIDYSESILTGFQSLYQILLDNRRELMSDDGPLSAFNGAETRVIFRDTRIYASFLLESLHPDYLGDALERDIFFDQLWVATEHRPYLSALIKYEQKALRRMDVPMFTTKADSRNLKTDDGVILKDFFENTGIERTQQQLSRLSRDDLHRQMWVIRSALLSADLSNREACHSPIVRNSQQVAFDSDRIMASAVQIGQAIEQLAFRSDNGASWFTWKAVGNSHWDLEPMNATLYDGLAGMVLFFAYAGHVTGKGRYRQLAEESLNTARYLWQQEPESIHDIGLFSGWGGLIYVLCHLSALWNDEKLLDEARALQAQIAERMNDDESHDIVGGCAGAIVALLILHDRRPDEQTKRLAIQCGERLMMRKVNHQHGAGWVLDAAGSKMLAGMSHGAAGISVSLAMLYQITGEEKFLQVSLEAVAYERSLYSDNVKNWPDLRVGSRPKTSTQDNGHYFMTAWCHGAPGIGLARLRLKALVGDNNFDKEIETAIQTTLQSGFDDNHCLCHGSLGNLDLLLEASEILDNPNYKRQAEALAAQIVEGQSSTGWLSGYMFNLETPGLMVGLAGMGYELLRVAHADKVPSVLSFEAPLQRPQKR